MYNKKYHTIVLLLLMMVSRFSFAQMTWSGENRMNSTFNHELLIETPVWECTILGEKLDSNKYEVAPAEASFTVIGTTADGVIVKFWKWNDPEKSRIFNARSNNQPRFFFIRNIDFNSKAIKRYNRRATIFTIGTAIVPVKMRYNPFDFSKDFTIGPTAGAKIRFSKYADNFLNVLLAFGVTSVTLDSLSTRGRITRNTDRPALTPSLGFVTEFDLAQIGIFTGLDLISRRENVSWIYQRNPWVSIGLGFTILSRQSSAKANAPGTQ